MIKFAFQWYLKFLAKAIIKKFRPQVIAICGSSNKSTAVASIVNVLKPQIGIAASLRNYNAEIGVPLSILQIQPEGATKIERWSRIAIKALRQIFKLKEYPKILLLEFGMHTPQDAENLLRIIVPDICIFTNLQPSIIANDDKSDQYYKTFSYFLKKLPKKTILITNGDDPHLEQLRAEFPENTVRFGQDLSAAWRLANLSDTESGQQFNVVHDDENYPLHINEFGIHHIYITAMIFSLASILKLDLKAVHKKINAKY